MIDSFKLEKQNALSKADKSDEQKWDKKIVRLCNKINSLDNYFTTSSCAGRITLIKSASKKIPNAFLFKTHNTISFEEIKSSLSQNPNEKIIYFRQEPCALHVSCKTLDDAIKLLNLAKSAGLKRSGVFSNSNEKFTCELYSTEWIIAPLVKNSKILVDENYIEILVDEANVKLEKTWKKIERLNDLISHL